ncbi:MAG: 4a-hydroxytetrahydrobiopterin dehydratase [Acidimicrobiia bacterium]|nr:4a-hydroxytetrahydrobiopterin dehydratase [Acidimicrobiia bacterium]
MTVLPDDAVRAGLDALPGWERAGDAIVKVFRLPSFPDAVAFVTRVGFLAERADHHPDLDVRYREVRVALSTHSAGGITGKDLDLAGEIESLPAVPR